MTVVRRYTFKLYPNKAQEAALVRQAALLAILWNAALEQRETQWAHECQRHPKGERRGLSRFDQQRELKHIRADDPEFAAMSSASLELCIKALDEAFAAFFKRAKAGAGRSSGYPRYKSAYAIQNKSADCTIWHRDGSGWKMTPVGKQFRIYAKGIPGELKARGRFPVAFDDVELRDMRLIRVGGLWHLSVVVKMEPRRAVDPGRPSAAVVFNLIDEFASVEIGANGECLPGWSDEFMSSGEQITETFHSDTDNLVRTPDGMAGTAGESRRLRPRRWVRTPDGMAGTAGGSHRGGPGSTVRTPDEFTGGGGTDDIQSSRDTRYKKFSYRWRQETRRIAKRKAREARQRKEALHRWTTRLVAGVSELAAVCPPIKDSTRSARGSETNPGAAVKPVAKLNRHVLAQAPAMAIQMLEYKSAEAGVPFVRLTPDEHALAVGRDLPAATKTARRARRNMRKEQA